jgi:hypothetical protein
MLSFGYESRQVFKTGKSVALHPVHFFSAALFFLVACQGSAFLGDYMYLRG